jgi:hypothetical protein
MLICESCACRAGPSRCASSMPSIRAAWQSLLIGGDKTGDRRFYEQMIPIADALYDQHLAELEKEKNDGR